MDAYEQIAKNMYEAAQRQKAGLTAMLGHEPTDQKALYNATLEQITGHCRLCAELREQYHLGNFSPDRHWGETPEELRAAALRQNRHNTGVRNKQKLAQKYGEDAARRIIGK